jgi:hypothetical protein
MADTTISSLNTVTALSANNFIPISDGTNTTKLGTDSLFGFRNRLINGDMRIDQRNAGAAVTVTSTGTYIYSTDRYNNFNITGTSYTAQQVADAPAGFVSSTKLTFGSAISLGATNEAVFQQIIEGFNISDFAWGTENALSITLSFWVKASFTGISSVGFANGAGTRVYASTYTIAAANTWEHKTVVVPGDTSGTWLTNNMQGLHVRFQNIAGSNFQVVANDAWATRSGSFNANNSIFGTKAIGSPTSVSTGATWQITGVQLEAGPTATPFERRFIGTELALCQRYFEITKCGIRAARESGFLLGANIPFKVTKRAIPIMTRVAGGSNYFIDFTGPGTGFIATDVESSSIQVIANATNAYFYNATATADAEF